MEFATPIAANFDDKGLIVEFQDHGNLVPIHAEYDDPQIPEDYDTYG